MIDCDIKKRKKKKIDCDNEEIITRGKIIQASSSIFLVDGKMHTFLACLEHVAFDKNFT